MKIRIHVLDKVFTGHIDTVIKRIEGYAYQAEKEKDDVTMHRFFQAAEHCRRTKNAAI